MQFGRSRRSAVLLEVLARGDDIVREPIDHRAVQVRPDHDAQATHFLCVGWHRVGGQHPAPLPHLGRYVELVDATISTVVAWE